VADVHLVIGVAVIALNLLVAGWGAIAWVARHASLYFWYVLRAAQGAVIVQVLLGALLLVAGRESSEGIHYMYGTAPVVVNMFAEGMRAGAAQREVGDADFKTLPAEEQRAIALRIVRREMGIMTTAAFLVFAFGIRAAQTSGHLF
jgi:hypothetical protein